MTPLFFIFISKFKEELAPHASFVAKVGANYYRCQVHNAKEKDGQHFLLVLLVDYGVYMKILAQDLFHLKKEFGTGEWRTARALCCTLPGIYMLFFIIKMT